MKKITSACLALALLSGCTHPGQNRYDYQDVGQASTVQFVGC